MVLSLLMVFAPFFQPTTAAQALQCGLVQVAFCDTFDAPTANAAGSTRSGDLDGVIWGVSRATSDDNPGQGSYFKWNATHHSICGSQTVGPPRDVIICNGQLVESVTDGEAVTVLAMYPRQPFDFTGRTGTVVFDVGNDTQGPHAAWPAFVITDQPVPSPYQDAAGVANYARNSFGISFAQICSGGVGVDSMFTTSNYAFSLRGFSATGCVKPPTQVGQVNHFEIRISSSSVQVWASDAGSTTTRQIASASIQMPLTHGLIWIEDVHYNANKFDSQGTHTFVWDNVGFDGPVLARDLGFDVLDATHTGTSGGSLGYFVRSGSTLQVPIPNVQSLASATAALLEFNWTPHDNASITYSLNGHPSHTQAWPYGSAATWRSMTIALPVPLSELQNGTNSASISTTDSIGVSVANIDLILVAAGGIHQVGTSTATNTPVPAATKTPVPPSATNTPVATRTAAPAPQQGFAASGTASSSTAHRGSNVSLNASVKSNTAMSALIDIEVYDAAGNKVFQHFWDNQSFTAAQTRAFTVNWPVSATAGMGPYTVTVGVFSTGWGTVYSWNGNAATVTIN
jgi:hypothetical protein